MGDKKKGERHKKHTSRPNKKGQIKPTPAIGLLQARLWTKGRKEIRLSPICTFHYFNLV